MSDRYTVQESESFRKSFNVICQEEALPPHTLQTAITIVEDSLRQNPYIFPIVPNSANVPLRVAKTEPYMAEVDGKPRMVTPLQIWFKVDEDSKIVILRVLRKRRGFGLNL